ncbi:hypothetical protein BJX76DRAFT_343093 [Aspergillus varians]
MNEEDVIHAAFYDWVHTIPGGWPDDFYLITTYFRSWGTPWASQHLDEQSLSRAQKKQLIASLDGYCVQEDFDSIVSRLGHDQRKRILATFSMAFLVKTVVENFLQLPFWYAEILPKGQVECDDAPWQGVSPAGAVLESFWS